MLALAIVLPVLFVVVPGFMLILGLCRAAARVVPRPGDAPHPSAPLRGLDPVGTRAPASGNADAMRRQLAQAEYN